MKLSYCNPRNRRLRMARCTALPHGGPHSICTTTFLPSVTALEGCESLHLSTSPHFERVHTVSMPNYTGTSGS
ncbi:hypothetical protein OG21DRAFT_1182272 [Imleria badia]|nr:hypothetical protein OG21DRAFT_1182272 [Imleria badia]